MSKHDLVCSARHSLTVFLSGLQEILKADHDLYTVTDHQGLSFDGVHSWQQKLFNDLASL
jgi:hypothetical protein